MSLRAQSHRHPTDPKEGSDPRAVEIYLNWLDQITPHILSGNFEACFPFWSFPFRSLTLEKVQTCASPAELTNCLTFYRDTLMSFGVTELRRVVDDARFTGPDTIDGYHITHALRDGTPVVPPYAVRINLILQDGVWRVTEQEAVVRNDEWSLQPQCPATATR